MGRFTGIFSALIVIASAAAMAITFEASITFNSWDRVSDEDVSHYEVRWCPIEAEHTACIWCARMGTRRSNCDPKDVWCKELAGCQEWRTRPCIAYHPGEWEIGTIEAQTPEGIGPKTFWDTPDPTAASWDQMCIVAVDFHGNENGSCPGIGSPCEVASWSTGG